MCALRILTTRATAEGPEGESFRSLNATLVTDELLRDLRAALAARFRAAQNSTLTRTAIRSAVLLVLQDYRARGWLSAFGDLRGLCRCRAMRRCAAWSSPIPSRRGCTASPFRHR